MVTPYKEVSHLLIVMLDTTVPKKLFGNENSEVLFIMIHHFVDMKRFENYKVEDIINKMDIFKVPWL